MADEPTVASKSVSHSPPREARKSVAQMPPRELKTFLGDHGIDYHKARDLPEMRALAEALQNDIAHNSTNASAAGSADVTTPSSGLCDAANPTSGLCHENPLNAPLPPRLCRANSLNAPLPALNAPLPARAGLVTPPFPQNGAKYLDLT